MKHTLPVHAEEYIDPKKHMIVKLRDNERDRESVCVCVCEREREREREREIPLICVLYLI